MATTAEIKIIADTSQADRALGGLQSALKGLASIAFGGSIATALAKMAIDAQDATNKLRSVSDSAAEANAKFYLLADTAKRTGSNLGATIDLFQKLAASETFAGSSATALAGIVENYSKTLQISGADSRAAADATRQFAQSMQSGTLNGDEFRNQTELNGYFLRILQKELNISRVELRQMAEDGRLSAEIVGKALANSDQIAKDYAKTVRTIPQAWENLNTALTVAVKKIDDALGLSTALAKAMDWLANNIGVVIGAVGGLVVALGMLAASFTAVKAAMITTGWGALIVAAGAAVGYMAEKMNLFGSETKKADQDIQNLDKNAQNGLQVHHQRTKQALDLDKALKEQILSMQTAAGYDARITDANRVELEVQKAIALEKIKYLKTGDAMTAQQITQLANAVRMREEAKLSAAGYQLILENASSTSKILIDLAQREREINAAVANGANQQEAMIALSRLRLQAEKDIATQMEKDPSKTLMERYIQRVKALNLELEIANKGTSDLLYNSINLPPGSQLAGNIKVGSPVNPTEDRYKTILEGDINYNLEAIRLQQELYNEKLSIAEQYYATLLQLETDSLGMTKFGSDTAKQIAAERTAFEKKSDQEKYAFALDQASQMFSSLGTYNKKAFEAAKAFNIANAIMNAYLGATKALATYPPPFNFIAAAATVAAGLAQVAMIRSQSYSGRAIGGPVQSQNAYIVGERGPELFVPSGSGNIVRNDQLSGSSPSVNFTIQANDAAGFDQLLLERKGMIQQMISDAMLERGQRSKM